MYNPLLAEWAAERHQKLIREAEITRSLKEGKSNRRRGWTRMLVTVADWLIRSGQVLKAHGRSATHPESAQ